MIEIPEIEYLVPTTAIPKHAHFRIDGDHRRCVGISVKDGAAKMWLYDGSPDEEIPIPGGADTEPEIRQAIRAAARGSKTARDRLISLAFAGVCMARARREFSPVADDAAVERAGAEIKALHSMVNVELAKVGLRMPS